MSIHTLLQRTLAEAVAREREEADQSHSFSPAINRASAGMARRQAEQAAVRQAEGEHKRRLAALRASWGGAAAAAAALPPEPQERTPARRKRGPALRTPRMTRAAILARENGRAATGAAGR